jgi:hypothetical protein
VLEEFKNNSNLQYIDVARLFCTQSKLQEWVGKINEFAQTNPDTVRNSTPIELEEPEFSDSELNEEYECYKRNYDSSPPHASTPGQHPATREWVDISYAEMEVFLGTCFDFQKRNARILITIIGILIWMLPDRGFNRSFSHYWTTYGMTSIVTEYMAQSRFEQILRAGRCIGARGRNTMDARPMPLFGYAFSNPHCIVEFPYAEACMEKAFEWWKMEGPPPRRKTYLRNKREWRSDFWRNVGVEFMKDGRDKMSKV